MSQIDQFEKFDFEWVKEDSPEEQTQIELFHIFDDIDGLLPCRLSLKKHQETTLIVSYSVIDGNREETEDLVRLIYDFKKPNMIKEGRRDNKARIEACPVKVNHCENLRKADVCTSAFSTLVRASCLLPQP